MTFHLWMILFQVFYWNLFLKEHPTSSPSVTTIGVLLKKPDRNATAKNIPQLIGGCVEEHFMIITWWPLYPHSSWWSLVYGQGRIRQPTNWICWLLKPLLFGCWPLVVESVSLVVESRVCSLVHNHLLQPQESKNQTPWSISRAQYATNETFRDTCVTLDERFKEKMTTCFHFHALVSGLSIIF